MDDLTGYYGSHPFLIYSLFVDIPGLKSWPRVIFLLFGSTSLLAASLFQIVKLVVDGFPFQLVIELVPTAAATCSAFYCLLYTAFATSKQYNVLLSMMMNDLREARTEEENAIKRSHANVARFFIKTYASFIILAMCITPLSGLAPYFLDLLKPLNETRPIVLLANGEIFIDQEKYFWHIYLVECCTVFSLCIFVGGSESMTIIIGQHVCGMFAVIGHRLENITDMKIEDNLNRVSCLRVITENVRICIESHHKTLRFTKLVCAFYDIPLTVILISTMCALSISMVQVTDPQLMSTKMLFFTTAQVFQLFLMSHIGQTSSDASEWLSKNAYNAEWDICPAEARKLLKMIILRSSVPCKLVVKGIYTLSFKSFMSAMQTTISFYMVLRQSR